ncbi:MAG: PLP-dependent aminotransferase family protein [Clostridia bacterium]|nr:PLP-dependent aminotransferase family protein [Clostridia bacterium]
MITLTLDPKSKTPLYIQLYDGIKQMILEGSLRENQRLPSKRSLSSHLKISVLTVENAYGQLVDEGYLRSKAGSGYFVEHLLPSLKDQKRRASPADRSSHINEQKDQTPVLRPAVCDFSTKGTDTASFPFSIWRSLSRQVLSRPAAQLLAPCPSEGTAELRTAIAGYLAAFRGLTVDPAQIVVGAGSEYLVSLIIQLLGRDLTYGIENPGYYKIASIFREHGVRCVGVPLDSCGACPEEKALPHVLHITPAHHFPTGICMPAGRRASILSLMEQRGGYVIEDDYDSEFRYKGQIIPTLAAMDQSGRVIYLSTFTKLLAPSIRISYMVLPPALLEEYQKRLSFYTCTVPVFDQLTLASFISEGYLERHVNRMKKLYKKKRDALVDALDRSSLAPVLRIEGAEAGLHLLLKVENGMSEEELVKKAASCGVGLHGLSEYTLKNTPCPISKGATPCLVLGYNGITEEQIEQSVSLLEKAWIV